MTTTNIDELAYYASNVLNVAINNRKTIYESKQTKILNTSTSNILNSLLTPNTVLITDDNGIISSSTVNTSEITYIANLNKPIVTEFNHLNQYVSLLSVSNSLSIENVSNLVTANYQQFLLDTSNTIIENSNNISTLINNLNLDAIPNGTSKKYIINNGYTGDISISGNLSVKDLVVNGDTFTINTDFYNTSNLSIDNIASGITALKISKPNSLGKLMDIYKNTTEVLSIKDVGRVAIGGISVPQYALDVNGIINISTGQNFMLVNPISYNDLVNIPSSFAPSTHTHVINDVDGLQSALDGKLNTITPLSWNGGTSTLNINNATINLTAGHHFMIDTQLLTNIQGTISAGSGTVSNTSSSSNIFWNEQNNAIVNSLVKITSNSIVIDNATSNYNYDEGIYLKNGDFKVCYGDIIIENGDTNTNSFEINNNMIIESKKEFNKWRIYSKADSKYDLYFENSLDYGKTWNLRAMMRGSTNYSDSYLNFTGFHNCKAINNELYDDRYIGYIVSSANCYQSMNSSYHQENFSRNFDIDSWDFLPVIKLSDRENDKSVFGVITKVEDATSTTREENAGAISHILDKKENDRRIRVAGVGEGGIWVCDYNGNFESGDFITTSVIPGIGMKQDDEIIHNYTVGKITIDCDFNPKIINQRVLLHTSNESIIIDENNSSNIDTEYQTTEYEYEYDVRYVYLDGTEITSNEYMISKQNGGHNDVYKMVFVGCTYNCS